MRFADITFTQDQADDVTAVDLSVSQARAIIDLLNHGDTPQDLDTALDVAQGEVNMGNTTAAYVLICIKP